MMKAERHTIKATGHKATPQRLAILQAVNSLEGCFTPQELHQRLRGEHPSLGLVTVYRSLKLLAETGIICRIESQDKASRYARRPLSHHHHLVCAGCQRVVNFDQAERELMKVAKRLAGETGFAIQGHSLEFRGLCAACQGAGGRP
jgi:Fe2+ or Zn2+ uptake regulation protein